MIERLMPSDSQTLAVSSGSGPAGKESVYRKSFMTGCTAALVLLAYSISRILFCREQLVRASYLQAFELLTLIFICTVMFEVLYFNSHRIYFAFSKSRKLDAESFKRIVLRSLALLFSLMVAAIPVALLDMFYAPVMNIFLLLIPSIMLIGAISFIILERHGIANKNDEWLDLAELICRMFRQACRSKLSNKELVIALLAKQPLNMLLNVWLRSYFGTLLLLYYINNFQDMQIQTIRLLSVLDSGRIDNHLLPLSYLVLLRLVCTLDSGLASLGYLSASRIIGTEIRSVDRTWSGWFATLVCYHPFCLIENLAKPLFTYSLPEAWLNLCPLVWCISTSALLILIFLYICCNMSFGLAFSNLTNRGIVASGPYSIIRHPAYAIKLLIWWICMVPLCLQEDLPTALVSGLGMTVATSVYYLRAITEENHLLSDPSYLSYMRRVRWRFIPYLL